MKIAFATIYNLWQVERGSGTFYHLAKELERQGHTVYGLGPFQPTDTLPTRLLRKIDRGRGKRYKTYHDPFMSRALGRQLTARLAGLDYDVLLVNEHWLAAFVVSDRPIVLYTDNVLPKDYFAQNIPITSKISRLSRISVTFMQLVVKKSLHRSDLCVFPAKWLADEALKYGIDASKIRVIPFGANIGDLGPEIAKSRSFSQALNKGRFDLLFVGKNWQLKGGDIAVETVRELLERGINAHLHIVGATCPKLDNARFHVYGVLDKGVARDRTQLEELYRICDCLILPSSREGFVIVALEAAAYGLPVIAYDVVGVNGPVINGQTGCLLQWESPPSSFADVVRGWYENPRQYDNLVRGARHHFDETVNWSSATKRLTTEMTSFL